MCSRRSTSACSSDSDARTDEFVHKHVNNDMHHEAFVQMNQLRLQNTFCDFVIKVGEKKYYCHKIVLSAMVPYFTTMLSSAFQESSKGEVEFPKNSKHLDIIIKYLYLGFIKITPSNITGILEMATYLGIDSLISACVVACDGGLVSSSNVLSILNTAKHLNVAPIINTCSDFINENFGEITETVEFLSVDGQLLVDIISSEEQLANEEDIWQSVAKWVRHDEEGRRDFLPHFMEHIKFDLINPTYLWRNIANDDLLKKSPECKEMIFNVLGNRLSECDIKGANPSKNRFRLGDIYLLGGRCRYFSCRRDVLKFNTAIGKWTSESHMGTGVAGFGAVVLEDKVYTVGGDTRDGITTHVQQYDIQNTSWLSVASMNEPRHRLGACALHSHIFACGGEGRGNVSLNSVERYDSFQNRWVFTTPMNEAREGLGVVFLDGSVWAIGGLCDSKILNSVERFDPRDGYWAQCTPMTTARHLHGTVVLGNKIYACGGMGAKICLDTVEEYDPRNNKWTFVSPMNIDRSQFSAVVYKGQIWAIAGEEHNSVEVYDVKEDKWSESTSLTNNLEGHCAVVIPRLK